MIMGKDEVRHSHRERMFIYDHISMISDDYDCICEPKELAEDAEQMLEILKKYVKCQSYEDFIKELKRPKNKVDDKIIMSEYYQRLYNILSRCYNTCGFYGICFDCHNEELWEDEDKIRKVMPHNDR